MSNRRLGSHLHTKCHSSLNILLRSLPLSRFPGRRGNERQCDSPSWGFEWFYDNWQGMPGAIPAGLSATKKARFNGIITGMDSQYWSDGGVKAFCIWTNYRPETKGLAIWKDSGTRGEWGTSWTYFTNCRQIVQINKGIARALGLDWPWLRGMRSHARTSSDRQIACALSPIIYQ